MRAVLEQGLLSSLYGVEEAQVYCPSTFLCPGSENWPLAGNGLVNNGCCVAQPLGRTEVMCCLTIQWRAGLDTRTKHSG
jgi:hypothetical protein